MSQKKILGSEILGKIFSSKEKEIEIKGPAYGPRAFFSGGFVGQRLFTVPFDGEKNLGEAGPIKNYVLDHQALSMRSWQSYLESELTPTVIDRFITWSIGSGLKLQASPVLPVLNAAGIDFDNEEFNKNVEARWKIFSETKMGDYTERTSLNDLQKVIKKNILLGGDMLVVMRYIDDCPKVQLIDGYHVFSSRTLTENGNRIVNGIELDDRNRHVAYYVRTLVPGTFTTKEERIPAYGDKSGMRMAFMVYGRLHRVDNHRGIPKMTVNLETLKKLERYKEATVGSAEERQKIVYQIVHQNFSTGESPLVQQMAKAYNFTGDVDGDLPVDIDGQNLANTVAATTNKQTYNMTPGAELKSLDSKNELYFKDFYETNINLVCASLNIPPNIAMSMYNNSFSASRAALKDWENTLYVDRDDFYPQALSPIYKFWFHTEVLKGRIDAPGYLNAFLNKDEVILEAYYFAKFCGTNVPHIDPLKEVNAERAKLGPTGANIPLTTVEHATRALNGGDSTENMNQYSKELERSISLGIEMPEPPMQGGSDNGSKKKDQKEED